MFGLELSSGRTRSGSLEPVTGSDAATHVNTPEQHLNAPASRDLNEALSRHLLQQKWSFPIWGCERHASVFMIHMSVHLLTVALV